MRLCLQVAVVCCAIYGGLALLGCRTEAEAPAAPAETAVEPPAQATAEAEPSTDEHPAETTPVDRETEAATLPKIAADAGPEGILLNPRDGVKLLLPEGYDQSEADDGSLLRLIRREPVGGVRVTITLDYSVDDQLRPETTLASLKDRFVKTFAETLVDLHYQAVQTRSVSVAGYPALELLGDLTAADRNLRAKKLIILQDKTFWYLGVIGPHDEFEQTVAPEFQAIAASLELP